MIESHHRRCELDLPALNRYFAALRRRLQAKGSVAVRLLDDAALRRLNRDFRGHDAATDVLSFPAQGGPAAPALPGRRSTHLGDIAISLDTAARQARALGHSLDQEVRILLLHGLLHLQGYDHDADDGAMLRREHQLRRALGLPPGLIERAAGRKMKAAAKPLP